MNRRSEKLDQYLNKQVEITFDNGDSRTGVLGWNEHPDIHMIISQQYYLRCSDGIRLCFRESQVKTIKEVR